MLNLLLMSSNVHHSPTASCLFPAYPNLWYSSVPHSFSDYIVLPDCFHHAQSFPYPSWIFEKYLLYSTKINFMLEVYDISIKVRQRR